jgi:hypothetical protein
MDTENAPTWEACKENVLPIKRGRSAKGLSESLQVKNHENSAIDKLREKVFEDSLCNAQKSGCKDLLEAYISYFKWTRDTFPSNSEKALHLLEVIVMIYIYLYIYIYIYIFIYIYYIYIYVY